jgi:hypothetical protein
MSQIKDVSERGHLSKNSALFVWTTNVQSRCSTSKLKIEQFDESNEK